MSQISKQPTALVIGAGSRQGIGGACAALFARRGYHVVIAGHTLTKIEALASEIRQNGGSAEAVVTDVTRAEDLKALFDVAMTGSPDREPADLVVYNAGNNQVIPFLDITPEQFEHFWRVGCYGGFLAGQEAARRLAPLGRGTIIFTGASGSLRGKANFAHFASAKAGLRMISQSMAREFGPRGLHIAHVLIDGGVNGDRLKALIPEMVEKLGDEGLLNVDDIAEAYWRIHMQPRSAWTQEMDLRPFAENF